LPGLTKAQRLLINNIKEGASITLPKVYFAGSRAQSHRESLVKKVDLLFDRVGVAKLIRPHSLVAIKLHFGERGGTAFLNPVLVRRIVEKVKEAGGKPFLCDSNTLYTGGRTNAVDHLETALQHGFSYATVGAPLLILDGLRGHGYYNVAIEGKHFNSVQIGAAVVEADLLLVLSHVKGHMMTGFGGAIKNLSMGCSSRTGKQKMHSAVKPVINSEKCRRCGNCIRWCASEAIVLADDQDGVARINPEKCTGCGECVVSCRHGAVKVQWRTALPELSERMVEFACGTMQGKRGAAVFFNFLLDVIPDCDCNSWSDLPIVPDIGLLASTDPVAADQAAVDLINARPGIAGSALPDAYERGDDKFLTLYPKADYRVKLAYAEKMGLGSRRYRLVQLDQPGKEESEDGKD
jgi:uncharacterized Fe-S center protein